MNSNEGNCVKKEVATIARMPDRALPAILRGRETAEVQFEAQSFYANLASIFERWVASRESPHAQRAYRDDIIVFVRFMG